jgi:hypothetical protein
MGRAQNTWAMPDTMKNILNVGGALPIILDAHTRCSIPAIAVVAAAAI